MLPWDACYTPAGYLAVFVNTYVHSPNNFKSRADGIACCPECTLSHLCLFAMFVCSTCIRPIAGCVSEGKRKWEQTHSHSLFRWAYQDCCTPAQALLRRANQERLQEARPRGIPGAYKIKRRKKRRMKRKYAFRCLGMPWKIQNRSQVPSKIRFNTTSERTITHTSLGSKDWRDAA